MDLPTGFYPFWFWNDRLSADEVRRQVDLMAEAGIRGFYIHPRQGLGQPYLSDAFFEMVEAAVAAAAEAGLTVHLYDEFPYPSGPAGGLATLGQPQFHHTRLVQRQWDLDGGPVRVELPAGKLLSARVYPQGEGGVDWDGGRDLADAVGTAFTQDLFQEGGLSPYNRKRYFACGPAPVLESTLPPGRHRLFVAVQAAPDDFKYFGHYLDALNPDAVRRFIELTHERYRERVGRHFGTRILSVFTDEIEAGWSDRLPAAFAAEHGYDLCASMPALADAGHPDHLRVAHDLAALKLKLFAESFERPIGDWCRSHKLAYAGEKPSLRFSQLRYMDIPGCDPGHTRAGAPSDLLGPALRQNARAAASAAYFYGKPGALCECYHSTGWGATLLDARLLADLLLLMGVRYLVPHGFFYSTHGLRKHDAPPSFFFQMPYWPMFSRLADRVERIARAFDGTHIDASVLLVAPHAGLPAPEQLETFAAIQSRLMADHVDFLIADTDVLESARIETGRAVVRDVAASVVLVPPMRLTEPALADWLARFEAAGGQVVRCGPGDDAAATVGRVGRLLQPALRIRAAGRDASAVWAVTRAAGDARRWLLVNTAPEHIEADLDAGCPLRELPLAPGLPPRLVEQAGQFRRTIGPFEAVLLESADRADPSPAPPIVRIQVGGPADVQPRSPNLLRMGRWRMTLLDAAGQPAQSADVAALPLINQLEAGGFRYAPRQRRPFGGTADLLLPPMSLVYEFAFECRYGGPVALVAEPDSIRGRWRLRVNEGEPIGPGDLAAAAAHVRGSLGLDITARLRPGANTIRIELDARRPDDGLLNPLYLAGEFAVRLGPLTLAERNPAGAFEDYAANGLPFYAGAIDYRMAFDLSDPPPADGTALVEFDFGRDFHEAAEVAINGGDWIALPWPPRVAAVPAGDLRRGRNDLLVRVHTSLIRSFDGQRFDPAAHACRDIEPEV